MVNNLISVLTRHCFPLLYMHKVFYRNRFVINLIALRRWWSKAEWQRSVEIAFPATVSSQCRDESNVGIARLSHFISRSAQGPTCNVTQTFSMKNKEIENCLSCGRCTVHFLFCGHTHNVHGPVLTIGYSVHGLSVCLSIYLSVCLSMIFI